MTITQDAPAEAPTGQASSLTLHLLGITRVTRAGESDPLRFRARKHLALLVFLTIEAVDRAANRDLLAELLWWDAPPRKARHSLAQGISMLRSYFGSECIATTKTTVRLVRPLTTDGRPHCRRGCHRGTVWHHSITRARGHRRHRLGPLGGFPSRPD